MFWTSRSQSMQRCTCIMDIIGAVVRVVGLTKIDKLNNKVQTPLDSYPQWAVSFTYGCPGDSIVEQRFNFQIFRVPSQGSISCPRSWLLHTVPTLSDTVWTLVTWEMSGTEGWDMIGSCGCKSSPQEKGSPLQVLGGFHDFSLHWYRDSYLV